MIPSRLEAAVGVSLGLAALEEGDERLRPAATLQADFGSDWSLLLQNYGRVQQPVQQTTYVFAATRNYKIFGSKYLRARVGPVLAYEQSALRLEEGGTDREANTNLGLFLGLNWQSTSRVYITVDWGSAIFPAGLALLYLTTARKQSFSLGVGWRF